MLDFLYPHMLVVGRFFLVLLLAPCLGAAAAPKAKKPTAGPPSEPNIILITLDTTRSDRMGFLGSDRGLTPNLDLLAKQSVVFARAYAQVPLTTPSHAALLTGTYPQFSHVEDLGAPLRPEIPYLPDLLNKHGYRTAAFIGSNILDPHSAAPGFQRGFDVYDANFHQRKSGEDRYKSVERRAEVVADHALAWIHEHQKSGPFFVWLHFYDAHDPYDPPEPFKSRYASALYDGEIAYTDSIVGSFVEVLRKHGLYQNAVIAIAADHGEAFGEHGEERHGMFLYDETIHVPLLLKLPANRLAGKRVEDRVALAEVAPTLLEAAGMATPATMQARSLFPLFEGQQAKNPKAGSQAGNDTTNDVTRDAAQLQSGDKAKQEERPIYSETNYAHRAFGWSELYSWRTGKYLYVEAPKRELYDQSADPEAAKNLAPAAKAVADTLDSQLTEFRGKTSSAQTEATKLDPSQAEKLRALGYLASDSAGAKSNEKAIVDPKDKIEVANKFHRALVDLEEDDYEDAVSNLREVVKLEPDMASAYLELGRALVHGAKYEEALPVLRTAAEKNPESGMAHYELGLALIKTGQWEAALPEMQAAVVCTPNSPQLHFYSGAVHLRLKQIPEATAEFENSLKIDPGHFLTNLKYGEMLFRTGDAEGALPKLLRAVKVDPTSAEGHTFLADVYQELGQTQNSSRERAKAAELKSQPPQ
ncbi:MAG TPA: sulfatase-like hydrolase/transferase [Terriglobales bacterium]|nr:sulfatase-like hydrolase/transferase [Terriglobales bacterium]